MASHAREGHKAERCELRIVPTTPAELPPQSPLDFTLAVMRNPLKPDALRASLAKAALPYVHGRWCPLGSDPREAKEKLSPSLGLSDADSRAIPLREVAGEAAPVNENEAHEDSLIRHARPCAGHPRLSFHGEQDVDGRNKCGHDENKEHTRAAAETQLREMEQRALTAEAGVREMEERALAQVGSTRLAPLNELISGEPEISAEARLRELEARERANEELLAQLKTDWPDIFDASGAVRAPCADERDRLARLSEAQERARNLEKRAIAAEGALREAQFRARDMEQRALASEELIAWRR